MKLSLLLTMFLAFVKLPVGQTNNYDTALLSDKGQAAFQTIRTAAIFRMGGVGYSGETSPEELALRVLLKEPDGVNSLIYLSEQVTPEGILYALLGLRYKKSDTYEKQLLRFKQLAVPPDRPSTKWFSVPAGYLVTQTGCLIFSEEKAKLIKDLEKGAYDHHLSR